MHHGLVVSSSDDNELTAALLLPHGTPRTSSRAVCREERARKAVRSTPIHNLCLRKRAVADTAPPRSAIAFAQIRSSAPTALRDCFCSRAGAGRTIPMATNQARRDDLVPSPPSPQPAACSRNPPAGSTRRSFTSAATQWLRATVYSSHSMLCRGPASSIRWINSGVTGGGSAVGSSTGVHTSRNQPSIPDGVYTATIRAGTLPTFR